ncbi:pre-mRNA-processing factor 19-like [Varroa jacobsoni]|uniref:Pre-mRNA-processing factor 19 n=1 Tax=Varroa destructor TaxID=109461 RepID=A0A7M7KSP1_VARDE|nr:pre-mRNA-processing factor 19-like [Varroa destructor]XP_022665301.1 pre-mRNA-processing factor 19-like [Varroa destructor]XP_022665302.1 pre-mRNA-processing factor 19-like [Varroa destructor]XP_022665303.1 pre-mRNA-processing factor 19-like [Varroa destructor]XP_022699392.1 pre-mRNA-processing factor 19-like [Varroa jacobsoni]XP_022699393.1 pre-mRNA-processing factor 19-like [Varroa jacobsoni]XP_022699394.1 pre-mRNA-processing factor 19-like [Varroa jacobsoni]XP_022699395.1 pre-mRNA-proc
MALVCALSNEAPECPVVSPVSGSVFEKRLILKYISENGCDPITQQEMSAEQLIELKTPPLVKPRPPTLTSIPAILKALQDEWDAVMLNSFSLRQQLHTARQELSHALYQHDAACRVIARLTKEVTAAREALATLKPQAAAQPQHIQEAQENSKISETSIAVPSAAGAGKDEVVGMGPEVIQKLQDRATVLTAERKKRGRNVPEELTKLETVKAFRTKDTQTSLHLSSTPGILALDINPRDSSRLVTGGNDKHAVVYNKDSQQIVTVLKGHQKKVTHTIFHPDGEHVITASPDTAVRVWHLGTSQTIQLIRPHEGPISGLSLHATGDYVLTTATDDHWAFSDIRTGKVLAKTADNQAVDAHSLTAAQFHPDGLIFGTGTSDSLIKIWDLKERQNVANFPGHWGPVTAIAFSENGYYLATSAEDATVKIWDLRKLKNIKTLQLDDGYAVNDLTFDQSGQYLAVAGQDVRVYLSKQWELINVFQEHTAAATGVRFGVHASFIASVSQDRSLKLYTTP